MLLVTGSRPGVRTARRVECKNGTPGGSLLKVRWGEGGGQPGRLLVACASAGSASQPGLPGPDLHASKVPRWAHTGRRQEHAPPTAAEIGLTSAPHMLAKVRAEEKESGEKVSQVK